MRKILLRTTVMCAVLGALAFGASGQVKKVADDGSVAASAIRGTGKAAVIVVGSAGQAAWVTTKFVAKHAVWPVARTVIVKAPQKFAVYGLKTARLSLKRGLPAGAKIGFAYLKAKLP